MPNTRRSLLERTANLGLVLVSILSLLGPLAPARAAGPGDGEPDGGRVIGAISTVIRCLSPAGTEPGSVEPGEEGMPCVSSGLVYLDWHGNIARARLALRVAGAEAPHTILVNGQRAASAPVLPSESPDAGEYVYLTLSPQVVVPGENRIELTDDAQPGDRWTAMNVRIEVFGSPSEADLAPLPKSGNVPAVDAIVADASIAATRMVISFTSPYDGSTQEAEIQIPDGYTGDTPTPLVVYAHGRSSVMSAGIDALGAAANARGWLLASPQMHGSWVVPEECYIYPNDCTYDDQTLAGTTNANAEPRPGAYAYASPESQYDIIGTIRYMIDRYNVKLDQMYLVGDSMGGQIAAVTGAKFPHLFAAVFDNKGPTDADVWYDEQVVLYGTDGAGTLRAMRKECHIGGDPKGPPDNPFCYEQRSGVEYAGNWLHVPISMTHSVDDALVPVHHSRDLRDAINGYGPDRVALLYEDTVVGPTCPPYSHCLVPDPAAVLGFLSAYTLDNAPARVIATTDESKAFYWLNLVQSGGAHWSKVEAIADPATESVTVAVQDDQPLTMGINLGSTPIPVDEVGGALQQPGLGFPATTYLVRGGGIEELRGYASGYLDIDIATTGQSTLTASPVTLALSADPETVAEPQTETTIAVVARDRLGNPVPDGTVVELSTTHGTFPGGGATFVLSTVGGQASTTLTVGPGDTVAEVTATLRQVTAFLSIPISHGPNTAPILAGLPDLALAEDGGLEDAIDLWAYASDDETPDDRLTYTIDNAPHAGAGVAVDGNRSLDIHPEANWCGEADVTIRAADPGGLSDTDTLRVTVNCLNDPPWIEPVVPDASGVRDQPIVLDLTAYENDVEDSDVALDWTIGGEEHCVVSGQDSGDDVLTLTPQAGYVGSDTVTLHLRDSLGAEATQELVVTWEEVVQVQTVEVRVSSSADDAEEKPTGSVGLSSSDLELVYDGGDQVVGMRFTGLDVPRGATIVDAYVQFQVDERSSVETTLAIQGQATDDAAAFTAAIRDLSARSRTAASVTWTPPAWDVVGEAGSDQRTPDLSAVVQEVVSRAGWARGNALVMLIRGTGERVAESYNGSPSGAPLLHVEYSTN